MVFTVDPFTLVMLFSTGIVFGKWHRPHSAELGAGIFNNMLKNVLPCCPGLCTVDAQGTFCTETRNLSTLVGVVSLHRLSDINC